MNKYLSMPLFAGAMLLLTSCTTPIADYQQTSPALDIQTYFDGPMTAWGIVQDYNDKVTRRFCVELNGSWQGEKGLLKEKFYFDDGEISYRNWQLTRRVDGQYHGEAEDVVGQARGQQRGFAFQWQYELIVPIDDSEYQFVLDDWMYRIDEYRAFNRTEMKKFGITVAQLTLFFDKQTPLRGCEK